MRDLGYPSSNIQKIKTKDQKKELDYKRALANLTASPKPDVLTRTPLPTSLGE